MLYVQHVKEYTHFATSSKLISDDIVSTTITYIIRKSRYIMRFLSTVLFLICVVCEPQEVPTYLMMIGRNKL